jgi:hypothetical protein
MLNISQKYNSRKGKRKGFFDARSRQWSPNRSLPSAIRSLLFYHSTDHHVCAMDAKRQGRAEK